MVVGPNKFSNRLRGLLCFAPWLAVVMIANIGSIGVDVIFASEPTSPPVAWQETGNQETGNQETGNQEQSKNEGSKQENTTPPPATEPPATEPPKSENTDRGGDEQLFYNPKYDDSALPVRREEEWTPPPPIDWSIEGPLELNFDHLKFKIQADQVFEVRQLTLDLLKLRGRTIKIRGYIRPSFKEKDITRFVFVRDNQECCFGPGALLYDCMIVNMAPGQSVNFSTRPITIEGRFTLKPFRGPDKRVWAIFEMMDSVLK